MLSFQSFKKIALSLSIVVVMNIFFNVGIDTFLEMPEYDDICPRQDMSTAELCEEVGGEWIEDTADKSLGWCDYDCWENYEDARAPYEAIAFGILMGLGLVVLLVGLFAPLPMAVLNGFLYGGILSMIIATMRYWSYMEDVFQFVLSGVVLAILVAVGIKKLKD